MYIKLTPIIRTIGKIKILLQSPKNLQILEFPVICKIPLLNWSASLYTIIIIIGETIEIIKIRTPTKPIEFKKTEIKQPLDTKPQKIFRNKRVKNFNTIHPSE